LNIDIADIADTIIEVSTAAISCHERSKMLFISASFALIRASWSANVALEFEAGFDLIASTSFCKTATVTHTASTLSNRFSMLLSLSSILPKITAGSSSRSIRIGFPLIIK
jgi:hypothetical protein